MGNQKLSNVLLNEILSDAIDLFLRLEAFDGVKVEVAVAFQEPLSNAFDLLSIFVSGAGVILFGPYKMQHLFDAFLFTTSIY